jgi:hypothetical protein
VTAQINVLTMSSTGAATFTAANGDTLSASVVGQATRIGPTTLSIVEVYTITGGTGRFADATGSFTVESTVDQTSGASSGTEAGRLMAPLILSCNPAHNELKPGQRQPLPKKPRALSGRRLTPGPGF